MFSHSKIITRTAAAASRRTFATSAFNEVVIVSAARTPTGSFQKSLSKMKATELGAIAIKAAVERAGLKNDQIEEVFMGNVVSAGVGQSPARQAAIFAGLAESTEATTINKVCASGLKAIMFATQSLQLGYRHTIVAGGMESMSNVPFYFPRGAQFGHQQAIDGILKDGLWDVYNNIHMGNCAEETAKEYNISREEQDEHAITSYKRAAAAWQSGKMDKEIAAVTIKDKRGDKIVKEDEEYKNVDFSKVAGLRPAFQKEGSVTAANSSTLNDGASALVLMTRTRANELGLTPLARVLGYGDAACAPKKFTIAPSLAIPIALKQAGLSISDVDLFEINEAFSVVVRANEKIMGLDAAKVNVAGGGVALGHPIGSSGSRIVVSLVHLLNKCLIAAKRYHQSKSQDSTSPNREIVEMAELDDLGQDLYDGRAINVLLMTYYPDETNELEPPAVWKPSLSSKQILSNWERVAKLTSCHMGIHRQILLPLDLQEIETQRKTSSSGVNTTSICALFISFMVDVFQVCCQRTPAVQVKMAATPRVRRVLKSKVRLHHRPTSASTAFDSVGTSDSAGDRDTPTESTLLALDSNPLTNAASQDQDDAESSTVHKNKVEKVGRVESISRSHHSQKEISAGCLEIQPSNSKLKHQPLTSMKSDKKPHSKSTLQTTLLKSGERVPCRSTAQSSSRPEETRASTETISNSEVPSSSFLPLIHSHSHSTTSLISLKGIDTTPPFEYSESSGVVSTKPKSRRLKLRDLSKSNDFTLPLLPLPNCRSSSIDLTRPEPTSSPVTTKPASEATHLPSLFDLKPELPHLMITPVSSQATLSNQSTPVAYRRNTLVNLSKCKSAVIQMPYETLHPNRPNSTQSLPSQPSHSEDPHYAGSRPEINTAHASGVGSCEPRRATTPHGKIMTHTNTLELLSEKDTATDHDPVTTRDNSSEMDARATRESQTNRTLLSTHGETQTVAVSNIKLFKALGDGIEQSSDSCKPNPNPSEKPQDTLYPCLKLDGQIHDSNYNNDQRERDDTNDSATIDCKDSASSGLC
ncbi:hypothetical protein BASA81_010899, partial [Batrachochytrium salamandrivorans]